VNVVECTRIQDSAEADGDNRGLLFHASAPIILRDRALGIINVATDEWQLLNAADLQFLTAVGAQVTGALERAQLYDELDAQRLRLEREMELAREVQASLLPRHLPEILGFSFAAEWRAAREMAGDFYDAFALPDGRYALVVADVSDKGAPAALYMAMTRSLIRASAGPHASPAAMLREVNRRVTAHASSGMFVTVFCAVLDPRTRVLTYANAGHNPPLLRRTTGTIETLAPTGPLIGVFDELKLGEGARTLAPGDTLIAYTDGATDALNSRQEEFGIQRLRAACAAAPASEAARQLAHILEHLAEFTGDTPAFDDLTLLIVAVEGEQEEKPTIA
jgi:sigma-B regulation protein RsbU (phosphoserine phosphatase)